MAGANLEWVTINDFRPGIAQMPGINHPPGTAVEDQTFGCIANESGALVGTPAINQIIEAPTPDINPEVLLSDFFVGGFFCLAPVFDLMGSSEVFGENQNSAELWAGLMFYTESGSDTIAHRHVYRYMRSYDTPVWQYIAGNTVVLNPGSVAQGLVPVECTFGFTTANPDDNTQVGLPVVVFCFQELTHYFPNFDSPTTNSLGVIPIPPTTVPPAQKLVTHQGRVVLFPLSFYGHGELNARVVNGEAFYWTQVNNPEERAQTDGADMGFFDGRFQSENPTGWQNITSLTANELFVMKQKGGATVIRGDLDDPTVVNLPNVMGCGEAECQGTPSQIGFVYPIESGGVYLWQGGDTSESISKNMLDDFWRPTYDEPFYTGPSNCAVSRELVLVPNGWMYNTDHGGWWRFTSPDEPTFVWHQIDTTSRWIYCTPLSFTQNDDRLIWEFDRRRRRQYFSWKSHPLMASVEREIEAREIIVSASGFGEVTVHLVTRNGQQHERTVRFDNEFPDAFRLDTAVQGTHLQVWIESQGDEGQEAPTVYEVRVGMHQRQRISRGSS